jgi:putative FmdB family regulatory protein
MPVYEFECKTCGEPFDLFVRSMKDMEDLKCPECGSAELERIFSSFGTSSGSSAGGGGSAGDTSCASRPFK